MVEGSGIIDTHKDRLKLKQLVTARPGQTLLVSLRVTNEANESLMDTQTIGMHVCKCSFIKHYVCTFNIINYTVAILSPKFRQEFGLFRKSQY